MTKMDDPSSESPELSGKEEAEIEEHKPLRAAVIYEVIRGEGEGELARSVEALWWSGLAAGLTIGLSVLSQALLATYLPETAWNEIIEPLGYSVGFIVVIMARQQLFTENTLTAVLPVMKRMQLKWLIVMLRLWAIVLVANLVGCLIFAATVYWTSMLPGEVVASVLEIGDHLLENNAAEMFVKGIAAGWLIAALVWVIPSADNTAFFMIGLVAYVIALAGFTHVVAGSAEVFTLWFAGDASASEVFLRFLFPTLLGNIVGGTVLFALISYAQVRAEIRNR